MSLKILRYTAALLILMACVWAIRYTGLVGASRLLSFYGRAAKRIEPANAAVALKANDPEAHYARALVLIDRAELSEAITELERAVKLRPQDYLLWLELGRTRDQADDSTGAIQAFNRAIALAPFYAQPRWQLGNVLFRQGRRDEAFSELRRAATSDPALLPNLIDLAWGASAGNAPAVEQTVQPQNAAARLVLARFFVHHDKAMEAIALFRAAGGISADDARALLTELINKRRFVEAYNLWLNPSAAPRAENRNATAEITDGGFENAINLKEVGFGWRLKTDAEGVKFLQDKVEPRAGAQSLRLEFKGSSDPGPPIVSQLVLVEPKSRYRLRFAARGKDVLTGGLPFLVVNDATRADGRELSESTPLPQGTSEWQDYDVGITTGDSTRAVWLNFRRRPCTATPCPVFGTIWLDDFTLQKL